MTQNLVLSEFSMDAKIIANTYYKSTEIEAHRETRVYKSDHDSGAEQKQSNP
jgi:hypothetical protein